MRVAVAGLGGAAIQGHLPALRSLADEGRLVIAGCCDPSADRRALAREAVPGVPCFDAAQDMLAAVRADLLVVAASPDAHQELARLAVAHRLHLLCEKPADVTGALVAHRAGAGEARAVAAAYQYRFSPPWALVSRFAQAARDRGAPLALAVDVERPGTDTTACSRWRDDPAFGGGLADHAVHFLALARAIGGPLRPIACTSEPRRTRAALSAGAMAVAVSVDYRAAARRTRLTLETDGASLCWEDARLTHRGTCAAPRTWAVPALSDRAHVDALYLPLYRDLIEGVTRPTWRRRREDELSSVSEALAELLALASDEAPLLAAGVAS